MLFIRENLSLWLAPLAKSMGRLELIWPFPLIAVGLGQSLDSLAISIGLVLTVLPWGARLILTGRMTRLAVISGPLLLFVAAGLLGVGVAYDPALSWPMLLTLLGSISLFYGVVNTSVEGWWLARGVVIVAAGVAFYFVGQYAHFDYSLEFGRLVNLGRRTGSLLPPLVLFTPHPNAVAAFLEGTMFLNLVLLWRAQRHNIKPRLTIAVAFWGATLIVIGYALLISRSRGAWVGLLAAGSIGGMLIIPNLRYRMMAIRFVVVGVVVAVPLVALTAMILENRFLISLLETAHSRFVLYRNSFYLLQDYILTGIGLGEVFALVYSRYQLLIPVPFLYYAHNLFLAIGLGMGFLGLGGLLWLVVSFYRFVVRVEQWGGGLSTNGLFRAGWLGVTAIFIHGLTDSPQFASPGWTMPMLFFLLGLTVAAGRPALVESRRWPAGSSRFNGHRGQARLVGLGLSILLSLVALGWRPLLGASYVNLGAIYQTRADLSLTLDDEAREKDLSKAADYFARALALNPGNTAANRRLGILLLDQADFEPALIHLEQALQGQPRNQATLKALGLAYLWRGEIDKAEALLVRLDPPGDLVNQLEGYRWWWRTQQRPTLSRYADEMLQRLPTRPR